MKKLLFMINSFECGGAEKSLVSLLNELDFNQYQVFIQVINRGGMFENLLPDGVTILPELEYERFCKKTIVQQIFSNNLKFLKARVWTAWELRKNARYGKPLHDTQAYWKRSEQAFDMLKEEYDVAIAWGQGTPTHFIANKVRAKKKIAWINADYEAVGHNAEFDLEIYGQYQIIVCVSNELSLKMQKAFPVYAEKIRTIYDINNEDLIVRMSKEVVNDINTRGVVIVTVGRLVKQKGYDIAINAASSLKKKNIDFTWYIIGEGPERRELEKRIREYHLENNFVLLGAKKNPYPYMRMANVYVQTSKSEGFCITLAEARILNRPCVTTAFDTAYDQIIQGKNGLIVAMNAESVADGIWKMLNDPKLYFRIQKYQESEKKGNKEEIEKFYELLKR